LCTGLLACRNADGTACAAGTADAHFVHAILCASAAVDMGITLEAPMSGSNQLLYHKAMLGERSICTKLLVGTTNVHATHPNQQHSSRPVCSPM
jgi:hypothetical protein